MSSIIIIKRRLVRENNQLETEKNLMVTSTPIKSKIVQQSDMEWPSPVEKSSNEIPSPHVSGAKSIPIKATEQELVTEENGNLEKKKDAATESIDKICLVNRSSGPSNFQVDPPSDNIDSESESKKLKQLKIMDSDEEEEFWQNRGKSIEKMKNKRTRSNESPTDSQQFSKKIKTQQQTESIKTLPSVGKSGRIETQNNSIILPNIIVDPSKDVSAVGQTEKEDTASGPLLSRKKKKKDMNQKKTFKGKNNLKQDRPSKVSSQEVIVESIDRPVEETNIDDGNAVRRSNRKRCKPLEFWNGERMKLDIDLASGIRPLDKKKKNLTKSIESEEKEFKQNDQVSGNIRNLENTHKPETNITERSGTKRRRRSILKSIVNTKSKANVRFSDVGTGTTIDGPTSKKRIKPDWVINFPDIHSREKLRPDSENCVILPGLNTAMKIITSAIIQMRRKAINHSQASDQHHLIFCVMVGTITVTIDETSVRMNTFGHFTVPCGVSYSIENTGRQNAILSFFKVACACTSK